MAVKVNGLRDDLFEAEEYSFYEESETFEDDPEEQLDEQNNEEEEEEEEPEAEVEGDEEDSGLPQCKIKRNYACPECAYFTQNPRTYLYHLKNEHNQKLRVYECPHCIYASKHSQKLHRHLQMVHSGTKKKRVRHAAVVKTQQYLPPVEMEGGEDDLPASTGEGKNKVFKCPTCTFTSRSQILVMRHEKVVHLKKKFFRCTKCNYVTHMKARFTKHVKYHSMPMIKCDMCDFKTPYKWNLDRHLKNHNGTGAFKCTVCSFTADIKQSLTVHEMNHHVPPVMGHVTPNKRKNRVGASDLQPPSPPPPPTPPPQMHSFNELSFLNEIEITKKPENPPPSRKPVMKKPNSYAQFSTKELTMKMGEKLVSPNDILQQKNGTVYVKKLKCRVCNYRSAWESEMVRHEQRVHGVGLTEDRKNSQKSPRPIPNLIPIQNKPGPPPPPPPMQPSLHHPPPHHLLAQQPRPMMPQQKQMMHHMSSPPQYPPGMNRYPFPPPHIQHQMNLAMSHTPQTHNLPPSYAQQMPSRFAQPKNIMQKLKRPPYPMGEHLPQKQLPPKPSPPPPPILKIPTPTKSRTQNNPPSSTSSTNSTPDKTMTDKDLNDICAKSCPTSSLKDFASLMGGDEFQPEREKSVLKDDNLDVITVKSDKSQDSISENLEDGPKSPEGMKKKNSFFDQLKEKFVAGESCNLMCNVCGHESKCLSESLRHQKTHKGLEGSSGSGALFSNADLSSTRCQYCRQRCKTSSDLLAHMKNCAEANKALPDTINLDDDEGEEFTAEGERMDFEEGEGEDEYRSEEGFEDGDGQNPHPMENKVFVWTNMANGDEDGLDDEYDCGSQSPHSDCVFGVETAPGIGAVTSKNKSASATRTEPGQNNPPSPPKPKPDNSVKKVYKCPHCSFWASTASRFHVHIVGHLNKKPFECSLCCYRSNWRWDITKHIRLKTMRDSTHQRAKVLMTDETGRRNYSKYNKYLTMMRVHEPNAESGGLPKGKKMTQSFEPIETVPPLPKLTPAPQSDSGTPPPPRTPHTKPPPLHPSNELKRKAQEESEDEPSKKKGLAENKKTMWKCKKCLFRDSDRAVVLAHVKGHYRTAATQGAQSDSSDEASSYSKPLARSRGRLPDEGLPYKCGHCPQTSQWKHVIQRHCRLKHNGNVSVMLAPRNSTDSDRNEDENEPDTAPFMCETCPFVASSQQSMDDHMEKHFERPGAILKCYFCHFFVSDKDELVEHVSLHGEPETDGTNYSTREEDSSSIYSSGGENGDPFREKRYRCTACPYSSNSKTQFLYHKQFHRPRGAPFQCSLCSYNVPRRHFLQQHLRLHGINTPLPKLKTTAPGTSFMDQEIPLNIKEIDTSNMTEIPLVWVSKLGSLTKMFKCRYCPHVNIRKSNIQEHEKMHGVRTKPNPEGSSPIPQQQHHCPECNYICNNAGVLSSHTKVHQGLFGQVCGLVDMSRKDEDQIRDLNTMLGREEEGPPEILPDEINKDFKESQPSQMQTPEKENTDNRVLHFCSICPARFLYPKELEIHLRFHSLQLQFQCDSCSYTARQQPHLLAHYKVHTDEYQDRTSALCEVYQISEEHPKPKIAVIVDGSEEVGPAWVVVERQTMPAKDPQNEYDLDEAPSEFSQHGSRIVTKQFACDKCPATFFKSVALQYHLGLHGGPGPHKCRVCNYSVKTYGNLIKHETVHEELEPRVKKQSKSKRPPDYIPASGTELFKQKNEANQKVATAPPPPPPLHIDPEFGILMHGSPEFIYPTYLKNGRLKEKRYKCHKCPSAFEKREQYKVHLSLHGSKQRYSCERCDYSVKYYANYIQHLKKHQSNDATKAERKSSTERNTEDLLNDDGSEATFDPPTVEEFKPQPPITASRSAKKIQLSMADQQTMMLMQQRVIGNSNPAPEVTNRCPHCPYTNQRKEGVGSHVKCHNNAKGGAFACKYCNYTVPQLHFLRDHNKLHFMPLRCNRPEGYMKCDRLELWAEPIVEKKEDDNVEDKPKKVLIFKDRGVNSKEIRFLPDFTVDAIDNSDEDGKERIYINLKTGEPEANVLENCENSEKEEDKENNLNETPKKEKKSVEQEFPNNTIEKEHQNEEVLGASEVYVKVESDAKGENLPSVTINLPVEGEMIHESVNSTKDEENVPSEEENVLHIEENEPCKEENVPCEEELLGNDNELFDNYIPMEVDEDQLLNSPKSEENCENSLKIVKEGEEICVQNYENEHFQASENNNMEEDSHAEKTDKVETNVDSETVNIEEGTADLVNEEANDQTSAEETLEQPDLIAAATASSDSDSEDSSSDSSSSSDSNDSDSSSTSVTSQQS